MTTRPRFLARISHSLVCSAVAALALQTSSAHQLWLELVEGKTLVARFGQYGNGEPEKSPGRLDRFQALSAWVPYAGTDIEPDILKVSVQSDGFLVEEASAKQPVLLQASFPVRKREAEGDRPAMASYTQLFARWHPQGAKAEPSATLDVIPSEEQGKATVYFQGKPAAGVKVTLFHPGGEPLSLESDEAGVVTYPAEAPGSYVLWAHHSEPATGMYLGTPYTSLGYTMSLCWNQA